MTNALIRVDIVPERFKNWTSTLPRRSQVVMSFEASPIDTSAVLAAGGRVLRWSGGVDGDWEDPSNWTDDATGQIACSPPGIDDIAVIDGGSSVRIEGAGAAQAVVLSGSIVIAGAVETGSVVNTDTSGNDAVFLGADGSLIVAGNANIACSVVLSGSGSTLMVGGVLSVGAITLSNDASLTTGTLSLSGSGQINMDATSSVSVGDPASGVPHPGFLVVQPGAILVLPDGSVSAPIWNDGILTLSPSSAIPTQQILGSGTVVIEPGFEESVAFAAMMQEGPTLGASQTLRFDGPNASLFIENGANTEQNPILVQNFGLGDTIAVLGTTVSATVVQTDNGDLLDLTELVGGLRGSESHQFFLFDSDFAASGLGLQTDFVGTGAFDAGYTTISLQPATPCFCPGTLIATPDGERAVETLRIGDLVETMDGGAQPVLWIGRRSYNRRFAAARLELLPIRIKRGALGAGLPRRDLLVSPRHAMLVQDNLVPAELLVNNRSILREQPDGDVQYLHIEFENHELLRAEGAFAESFVDDNSRALFQNAAEFALLYPNRVGRAPDHRRLRVEHGERLSAAQLYVDMLAGLHTRDASKTLCGRVDTVRNGFARGWAWCPEHPEAPVLLDVLLDGRPVAQALANLYRADLAAAGLGAGCHGFEVALPDRPGTITVRRARDGALLAA